MLDWFVSYLSGREQRVVVNGKTSNWRNVTSGVPEGALLAPLLFALYINDLPSAIQSSQCVMFADDVKLFYRVKAMPDCTRLQSDLDSLVRWTADWRLKLNPSKCHSFTMTLRTCPVHFSYSIVGYIDKYPNRKKNEKATPHACSRDQNKQLLYLDPSSIFQKNLPPSKNYFGSLMH